MERFQPLWSYYLVHVFKLPGVLFIWSSDHQLDSILFYRFGICMLYYVYFVNGRVFDIFLFLIVLQSLNSPEFENLLLGDDLCKSILGWHCVLKSKRDSNLFT